MSSFLIVLQVIVCLLLITLVLLQPSKGGSFFTASNQGVFGSSGGTTFLFRATMWCAAFLSASCLFLSWLKVHDETSSVIPEEIVPRTSTPGNNPTTPSAAPVAPTTAPVAPTAPVSPVPAK